MTVTYLLTNCTAAPVSGPPIPDAAIAVSGDRIAWVGRRCDLPEGFKAAEVRDLGGRLVTPALIDCHTHIVHAGNRAREFEMRLEGASYEEIARAGGGINATVRATRAASLEELIAAALPFVDALIAEGTSVIEVKSGYGLDTPTELRMLRAARALGGLRPVTIRTTFLGAHAIPPEFAGRADAYIDTVCIPTLEVAQAEALVDQVDGFCEGIAFDRAQIERVFQAAQRLNLPLRLHAEQLSNLHGAALAARYGARSADHLEYLDEAGATAMAAAGTSAVILPGAFYTLHETRQPPIDLLRRHRVPMAVATDMNPGTSPMASILLAMNMACTLFRLTPSEALAGVTVRAAQVLGLQDHGALAPGCRADLAIWNVTDVAELAYRIGFNPLHSRIYGGQS